MSHNLLYRCLFFVLAAAMTLPFFCDVAMAGQSGMEPDSFLRRFNAVMRINRTPELSDAEVRREGPLYTVIAKKYGEFDAVGVNVDKAKNEVAEVFVLHKDGAAERVEFGNCVIGMITSLKPHYTPQQCMLIVTDILTKLRSGATEPVELALDGIRYTYSKVPGAGVVLRASLL